MKRGVAIGGGLAAVLALAAPLIMHWEGLEYTPYRDPVGIWTVCYGHTGPDVIPGKKYSLRQCRMMLEDDMAKANMQVRVCTPRIMPVSVEAALTSATFNIGPKVVCGSTLHKYALAEDWPEVCRQLDRWKYSKGRVFRGLVLRRADERRLCESGLG